MLWITGTILVGFGARRWNGPEKPAPGIEQRGYSMVWIFTPSAS
jgi:hypothetical protein